MQSLYNKPHYNTDLDITCHVEAPKLFYKGIIGEWPWNSFVKLSFYNTIPLWHGPFLWTPNIVLLGDCNALIQDNHKSLFLAVNFTWLPDGESKCCGRMLNIVCPNQTALKDLHCCSGFSFNNIYHITLCLPAANFVVCCWYLQTI